MLKRKKRGTEHLEMIISFVFFIAFIFFLFLYLNPYKRSSLSDSVSIGISESLKNYYSTNLTTMFLRIDYQNNGQDCIFVQLPNLSFPISQSIVKNANENKMFESFLGSDGKIAIEKGENVYEIYISNEFSQNSLTNCESDSNFTIGSATYQNPLSYNSILQLKNQYDTNYTETKKALGIPDVLDFAIIFDDIPEISMQKSTPKTEVYSKSFIFEVLKSDASIINTQARIEVW